MTYKYSLAAVLLLLLLKKPPTEVYNTPIHRYAATNLSCCLSFRRARDHYKGIGILTVSSVWTIEPYLNDIIEYY